MPAAQAPSAHIHVDHHCQIFFLIYTEKKETFQTPHLLEMNILSFSDEFCINLKLISIFLFLIVSRRKYVYSFLHFYSFF